MNDYEELAESLRELALDIEQVIDSTDEQDIIELLEEARIKVSGARSRVEARA